MWVQTWPSLLLTSSAFFGPQCAAVAYILLLRVFPFPDVQGDGPGLDHDNEEEVQAFMDAEEEALNEEERLLMDGPDFDHALQNAYQQGLDANNPDVNIPDVRLCPHLGGLNVWTPAVHPTLGITCCYLYEGGAIVGD